MRQDFFSFRIYYLAIVNKSVKRFLNFILKFFAAFGLITFLWVFLYAHINPPVTSFMLYQSFSTSKTKVQKVWYPIEEISPYVPLAVIASEDQKFLDHHGFDIAAIQDALADNKKSKKIRGASTISQQLAKNLFLVPNKSFVRKGFEAYFTVLIELIWSKRRIMEVYLNVVEMGDGVYGVPKASHLYFQKEPINLSEGQAALIATALPNPKRYSLAKPSGYMYSRQQWIQRQMRNLGGQQLIKQWYD